MNRMICFFCLMYAVSPLTGQGAEYLEILKTRSYGELTRHLDSEVQMEIGRVKQSLDREETISKLKERLATFKPVEWELMHKGQSESKDANYIIIKTTNASGEGLRLFFYIKESDGRRKINAIRFRQAL